MNGEKITLIVEVLQHLTVDQQLFGCRILYRKFIVFDEPLNRLALSSTQSEKVPLPHLPNGRPDVPRSNAIFILSVGGLSRCSSQRNQIAQNPS